MAQAQLRLPDAQRPLWPLEGDTCPVPGCVGFFTTYAAFNKHWVSTHEPYNTIFKCTLCNHISKRKYDAKRHTFASGNFHYSEEVKVVNSHYKSTFGRVKPRRGNQEERRLMEERREAEKELQRERQRQIDREERRRKAHNQLAELYFERAVELDWDDRDIEI